MNGSFDLSSLSKCCKVHCEDVTCFVIIVHLFYKFHQRLITHHMASSSCTLSSGTASNSSDIYQVGNFVYVETAIDLPYNICRIDGIITDRNKIMSITAHTFLRKNEIPKTMLKQAEQLAEQYWPHEHDSQDQRRKSDLRELYRTSDKKDFLVGNIRGKCFVLLLNEVESGSSYAEQADTFFYRFVYNTKNKTSERLQRENSTFEIRIGEEYQATVPLTTLTDPGIEDTRNLADLETLLYCPSKKITEQEFDVFSTVAVSVGTFGRSFNPDNDKKGLIDTITMASRSVTIEHAMKTLHKNDYNLSKSICSLLPNNIPVVVTDEIEKWSSDERSLFENSLMTNKKDFEQIRLCNLPWKSHKNLVEYYYNWKATDRGRTFRQNKQKARKTFSLPYANSKQLNQDFDEKQQSDLKIHECQSCKEILSCTWLRCREKLFIVCKSCRSFWKKYGAFEHPDRLYNY